MIDISTIKFNLQSEFHMLRHFESADEKMLELLLKEGYKIAEIKKELSLPGSKFHSDFANDIGELIVRFEQYSYSETIGVNGNLILQSSIIKSEFPNGIGTHAVIPIQDITDKERKNVYTQKNREMELLHYNVKLLPSTNECTLILKPIKNGYLFISSFPGPAAMPIPSTSMDLELYSKCRKFWDNHVFLEKIS